MTSDVKPAEGVREIVRTGVRDASAVWWWFLGQSRNQVRVKYRGRCHAFPSTVLHPDVSAGMHGAHRQRRSPHAVGPADGPRRSSAPSATREGV
jgi:hypothetical protein